MGDYQPRDILALRFVCYFVERRALGAGSWELGWGNKTTRVGQEGGGGGGGEPSGDTAARLRIYEYILLQ